jgi:chaperone required for assembly of F1-ATPase
MKRFYKTVEASDDGTILLDGRPVRTPARGLLALPNPTLSAAVAEEWAAQDDVIDPRRMPLTGLANAAIDRIAPDPTSFAAGLARYAETDLLCYRAEAPGPLVRRQGDAWDPVLEWARIRYDAALIVTTGILPTRQPADAVARLGQAVAVRPPFVLAGMLPLVTISGSLVLALALAEGAIDLDRAWAAAELDELWQAEQWGEDSLARSNHEARRAEFAAAARFLALGTDQKLWPI